MNFNIGRTDDVIARSSEDVSCQQENASASKTIRGIRRRIARCQGGSWCS